MRRFFLSFIAVYFGFSQVSFAQSGSLNEAVPYQGDTLLVNPLPLSVHDTDQAYLDCDWSTLMSMIRDLEERIAGALEVDTVYDVYVSGQVVDQRIYMNYDCVVLRDSVLSLQIQLDEALIGPPTVLSQQVMSIAQRTASIKAKVTDDGGAAMRVWGVIYGKQDWWNDSLGFFEVDSLFPVGLDFATMSDSLLADRLTSHAEAMDDWNPPAVLPIHTAMDTSILNVDSVFTRALVGLERYTNYIAIPVAANDSLMIEFNPIDGEITVDGTELNASYLGLYGMGDTLMFRTLPDVPSGLTLDTSSVTSSSALLKLSISDAGGQGPDEVTFYYDTLDFTANTSVIDSLSSDSMSGTEHTVALTGLTRYTEYYFNAFAENLAGDAGADENMKFRTLPEIPSGFSLNTDSVTNNAALLRLNISDTGGQGPDEVTFYYDSLDFTSTTAVIDSLTSDSTGGSEHTVSLTGLTRYTDYYFNAYAENIAGIAGAELNVSFTTLPDAPSGLTLDTSNVTSSSALLKLSIADAGGQGPDEVTFYYDTLDFASNTAVIDSLSSDSTGGTEHSVLLTGLTRYTDYYFNAFAENLADDVGADANMVFKTAAELPAFDTVFFAATVDSLVATLSDDGGVAPTSQQFSVGSDALLTAATDSAATLDGDTFRALYAGTPGNTFYANASATNLAGTVYSDTISFTTLVEVTPGPTVADLSASRATLQAAFDFGTAVPSTVGIKWGQQADLSDATDNDITLGADSTVQLPLTGLSAQTDYYFTAYAENAGGTAYGDTLAFTTKVALTDANISTAVNAWDADSTDAEIAYGHISDWDVSLVTNISWLFANKSNFNSDISGWDVSGVTAMNYTFMNAGDFNQPIGDWDVGAVTSMGSMFYNAADFNQPLENWDVGGVTDFSNMFAFASTFNQDLATWDVGWAFNMTSMFQNATSFNGDIGNWDTKFVTDMSNMFYGCDSLNQSLNSWDVSSVTDMGGMFYSANTFDQDLNNWDVSSVKNMSSMFGYAVDFNGDISNWNVGNVTAMDIMFISCDSFNQPLNSWDVSNVKSTEEMFYSATAFNQPLNGWDVSAVTSMYAMFDGAEVFNQDLNGWNVSSVKSMEDLFTGCSAFNGDISTWVVSNVTTMSAMFRDCTVFNGDIANWDVAAVTDMGTMFSACEAFNQDLGSWDVSQVTNMSRMFEECSLFNQDLSSWDVSAVEYMSSMFALSSNFNQDLSSWDISSVTTMAEFGAEASFSTAHYDAMLVAWSQLQLQSNVNFEINADWCYGDAARQDLIDVYSWSISDGNRCNPAPEGYTDPATNVALTSADLEGRFENMGTVSDAGFIVSTDETLAGATNQSAGTTSPFTLSLTGLTSSTRYYFQAYATDELGTVQGDVRSFTTQGMPIVSTIADTAFTDTTATLIGLSDGDVTPAATATGFKWGALSDLSDAADVAGDALTDTFTYALTASGPLYYAAYATNSVGTTYGDTIQLVGDAAVSTAAATDLSTTSAQLNATLTTGRNALTATGFAWGYQEDLSDATTIAGDVLTGDFSADLTGVDHEAKIYFSAFYTDDSGTTHGDTLSQCLKACEPFEYDGYTYETVLIDCQCWFAENLRSAQYSDGSSIPGGLSNSEWENTQSGAQAIYEADSTTYFDGYGRLYNHGAVVDSRGLCPNGWDVPTTDDFDALTSYLGGTHVAGGYLKAAPGTPGWDGAGTDVGWSALAGGNRSYDGFYSDFDDRGYWWSSSFDDSSLPVVFRLVDLSDGVDQIGDDWRNGYSIRCLRGAPSAPVASTSEASNHTNTTATLNGSVVFNGWKDATATGFKWGYAADLSDASDVSGDGLQDDFSADLTGLVTYDSLYYVAYVANDLGTAYGDTMVFEVKLRPCFGNTSYTYNGDDYDLVEIGEQCWFAENLSTTAYSNGDAIEESGVFDPEWETTSDGRYSNTWNETNPSSFNNYGEWYGYFYNWHAVNDSRGLCPTGWHVPDTADFTALANALGGMSVAGEKMKFEPSVYGEGYPESWDGTNESGWSGLPGGWRNADMTFTNFGDNGVWWTSTPTPDGMEAYWRWLASGDDAVSTGQVTHQNGFSVRCLAAPVGAPALSTDAASPVTETTATLNGSLEANLAPNTATGFKWGYQSDLSDGTEVTGDTLSGAFSAELTGLVTNDSVYFVAYATNAFGTTYGDTLAFEVKTPPCQNLASVNYSLYEYPLVEIGDQCWFAENLKTGWYRDGSDIPSNLNDGAGWSTTNEGGRSFYEGNSIYLEDYGRLYNWHAVNDARGLCPAGWHVPDTTEFTTLADALGGMSVAGEKMKASATDEVAWDGTNESGWGGLPGGWRNADGTFTNFGDNGVWWTSTPTPDGMEAYWRWLANGDDAVSTGQVTHQNGFSVRCLIDEPSAPVASTLEASNITDITATLNGSVDFNGWRNVTATGFKWGYAADLSDGVEVAGDTLAGEFTADLTGLVTDNTLYYVSYATNALGTTYGDTLSVLVKFYPCQGLTSVTYDGYDYDLVEIGAQCWFAENLRNDNYADGSTIQLQQNSSLWAAATSGLWTEYQNDYDNGLVYGYLYNWFAVTDSRGICPSGWHVPTDSEFVTLEVELGMVQAVAETNTGFRGTDQATKMKSSASDTPSWEGTNESGWSGLPGGQRTWQGNFASGGNAGVYWSSTPDPVLSTKAWKRLLLGGNTEVFRQTDTKTQGFSVRCLRDSD